MDEEMEDRGTINTHSIEAETLARPSRELVGDVGVNVAVAIELNLGGCVNVEEHGGSGFRRADDGVDWLLNRPVI